MIKRAIFVLLPTMLLLSCAKDECASKTFCLINSTGSDQVVKISGDYSKTVNVADGKEECLDFGGDIEELDLSWGSKFDDLFLDQCYTEYILK